MCRVVSWSRGPEGLIVDGSFVPDDDIVEINAEWGADSYEQVTVTATPYMPRKVVHYLRSLGWTVIVRAPEGLHWW